MTQKGFTPILIIVALLLAGAVALGGYWYLYQYKDTNSYQPSSQIPNEQRNKRNKIIEASPNGNSQPTQNYWEEIEGNEGPYSRKELTEKEYKNYLNDMGINSMTIPDDYGKSYLVVEWSSKVDFPVYYRADSGRMIILSFTNAIDKFSITYSTYDFAIGSEYDVFAQQKDFEAITKNEEQGSKIILIDNQKAYLKYAWETAYDRNQIRKIVVLPSQNHYLAFDYWLEGNYITNYKSIIQDLFAGIYPQNEQEELRQFDAIISSLKFQ